jgi:hypothetical protein
MSGRYGVFALHRSVQLLHLFTTGSIGRLVPARSLCYTLYTVGVDIIL